MKQPTYYDAPTTLLLLYYVRCALLWMRAMCADAAPIFKKEKSLFFLVSGLRPNLFCQLTMMMMMMMKSEIELFAALTQRRSL